jgi:hypothetical protein
MSPSVTETPFWKRKKLAEMTAEEWEALCDGCARCCLYKLEDEDTGKIYTTNVACKLLDLENCRCGDYARRHELNPDCLILDAILVRRLRWMPETCAYRLVAEGKDLPPWHYLVCGDREEVHRQGASLRYAAVSERDVDMDMLEDYVVESGDEDDPD